MLQDFRKKSAMLSTWGVCGNMSNSSQRSKVYPVRVLLSLKKALGLHEMYKMALGRVRAT